MDCVCVYMRKMGLLSVGENMVTTNSVASFSAYQHTHNPTSALYGGQFTLSTHFSVVSRCYRLLPG